MYQSKHKHLFKMLVLCLITLTFAVIQTSPSIAQTELTTVEAETDDVAKQGSWTVQSSTQASGGNYVYSSGSTDDVLTLVFEGTMVEITYVTHPDFGDFAIDIDNNIRRTVDTTADETTFDNRAVIDYLDEGEHTLKIYAVEGVIAIDAIHVKMLEPLLEDIPYKISAAPLAEPSERTEAAIIETAPGSITLLTPANAGTVSYSQPSFTWEHDSTVEWYQLVVVNPNDEVIVDEWLAGSLCTTICGLRPDVHQINGLHRWYIRGYNADGFGPYTTRTYTQTFGITTPLQLTRQSPLNNATTGPRPELRWVSDRWGEWYNIHVINQAGAIVVDQWVSYNDAFCAFPANGHICAFTLDTGLTAGTYSWQIRAWNQVGMGPFDTNPATFVVTVPDEIIRISPDNHTAVGSTHPTFQWNSESTAQAYHVLVYRDNSTTVVADEWVSKTDAGCPAGGTDICEHVLTTSLSAGSYEWNIQGWSDAGFGPFSDTHQDFDIQAPGQIIPISPVSNVDVTYNPAHLQWERDPFAEYYHLYVSQLVDGDTNNQVNVINIWLTPHQLECEGIGDNGSRCRYNSPIILAIDPHVWFVQAWNSAGGEGSWSAASTFNMTVGAPKTPPQLISPAGAIPNAIVALTWQGLPEATHYQVYVTGPDGVVFNRNLSAVDHGCSLSPFTCMFEFRDERGMPYIERAGQYTWWVLPNFVYDDLRGDGVWSAPMTFTWNPPMPTPIDYGSDTVQTYNINVQFTWDYDDVTTWYQLYALSSETGAVFFDQWYDASSICTVSQSAYCRFTVPMDMFPDLVEEIQWYVQSYNDTGGVWSGPHRLLSGFDHSFITAGDTALWSTVGNTQINHEANEYLRISSDGNSDANTLHGASPYHLGERFNEIFSAKIYNNINTCDTCASAIIINAQRPQQGEIEWSNGFAFRINPQGQYSIYEYGTDFMHVDWINHAAINQGEAWNTLSLVWSGTGYRFYINGSLVYHLSLSQTTSGYVGIGYYGDGELLVDRAFGISKAS